MRTNGDEWYNATGKWFPDDGSYRYWEWHGVETNEEGSIIGLDLSHNNLNGAMEPMLAELPDLRWLRLYGNPLKGCIPIALKDKLLADQYLQKAKDDDGRLFKVLPDAPKWIKTVVTLGTKSALEIAGRKTAAKWFPLGMTSTGNASELLGEAIYNYNPGQLGLPLCATPVPPLQQSSQTDKETLLAIRDYYFRWDNDNADRFPDWEKSERIGKWPGVQSRTINGEERVTRLGLDKRGLTGGIPGSLLARLGELRYLNLSRNELTGPIPRELGHLVHLHTLALNDNLLKNDIEEPPIPKELSNLIRLEKFYLQNNQLAGVIPQELAILTHTSMRIMNIDREGEHFLSGCLPPKNWGMGLDIRNVVLQTGDVVTWTLLSGGIHGVTRSSAQAAKQAGKKGVKISVPAAVKAFTPATYSRFNKVIALGIDKIPRITSASKKILAENVEKEVINQIFKFGASNYADGTIAGLVSSILGPG